MPSGAHGAICRYAYRRPRDQDAREPVRHRVIVVGAGPIGLTAAIDLALRGIAVVLLDDSDRIGDLDVLKEAIALAKAA